MKYLRSMGLAVLAALSVTAFVGVGMASASEPVGTPNPVGFPVTFTGTGGTGLLETTPEPENGTVHKVHCTASKSSGELSSASTVQNVVVTFTGCKDASSGVPCTTSGQASGTILTNKLHGTLVYLETGSSKTGVLLKPAVGTTFASFVCGLFGINANLTVSGEVLGELTPVNVSTKTFTLTFKKASGHPIPSSYLNPSGCAHVSTTESLKAQSTGAQVWGPLTSGLEGSQTLTFSKEVKVDATSCV
jgi:hypothetical protein